MHIFGMWFLKVCVCILCVSILLVGVCVGGRELGSSQCPLMSLCILGQRERHSQLVKGEGGLDEAPRAEGRQQGAGQLQMGVP